MTQKDWTGNKSSAFSTIGAVNYAKQPRIKRDYYATDPKALELLLEKEDFCERIWEPACGEGHLSKVLVTQGYHVLSTDIVYRGYGEKIEFDFLKCKVKNADLDIITNPPYRYATEFIEKALDVVAPEHKVAMFLKLTFLEGKRRRMLFDTSPPSTIYVSSGRFACAPNGDFERAKTQNAVAYAWFIWEKGQKNNTVIKWFN